MSISLKISHVSKFSDDGFNSIELQKQYRGGKGLETRSICIRRISGLVSTRIHLNSELSSRNLRNRCVGSDVITGGRSVPEWAYSGIKDETLSDLEPDLDDGDGGDDNGYNDGGRNGNGGGGEGGRGGGGDDGEDEGDKADEKEFGPLLKFEEVMKETKRRGITLPQDMLEAAKSVGIRKLFLLRYLDLQGSVWPLGFLMRSCAMLRNRMLADPSFLFKIGTELAIDTCCTTFAEVQKRGKDFWREFELYASNLLVGYVVVGAVVGLLAPYARIGKPSVASTGLFKDFKRAFAALPSSVFEAERPGCKFSVNQRIATFFYKSVVYGSVGFSCGIIGQGIANMIMTAKRSVKKIRGRRPYSSSYQKCCSVGCFPRVIFKRTLPNH